MTHENISMTEYQNTTFTQFIFNALVIQKHIKASKAAL